jgi:hypothetical protein
LQPLALKLLEHAKGPTLRELVTQLLHSPFNTDSPLARQLATVGDGAADPLLVVARGRDIYRRSKAYNVIGITLSNNRARRLRQPLSSRSERQLRSALLAGLRDRDTVCRRDAVRGVLEARESSALPQLRRLAATDPDAGQPGSSSSSVRSLAARAVAMLEER